MPVTVEKKKNISVFYVLISLLLIAGSLGFAINNVIQFNSDIKKNKELKERIENIGQTNLKFRNEIEKLTSFERIKNLAAEKLNMIYSDSAVDKSNLIKIKKP
jgi:cell division protein FtsB